MARSARDRTLDALLHRLWARAAAALLRSFSARQEARLVEATQGAAAGPSRRQIRTARRERMAAQTHAVDEILSRSGVDDTADKEAVRHPSTQVSSHG